jgi:hypothetical protein
MTEQDFTIPMNCQVCGIECFENELKTIQLSGFDSSIAACNNCMSKTAEDSFKDAAEILNDIVKIAASSKDPEKRLRAIRALLGE